MKENFVKSTIKSIPNIYPGGMQETKRHLELIVQEDTGQQAIRLLLPLRVTYYVVQIHRLKCKYQDEVI